MKKKIPRLVITAPSSGSGKTMITCALLKAFVNQGINVASFKCGPDYIDPMFHREVLGVDSDNLDMFLCGADAVCRYLSDVGGRAELSIIEGAMGYYDGVGGDSVQASAYDVARTTNTPVVLVVDGKGMSVSIVPYIQGFARYKTDSQICGILLNRISPMMYERMKTMIEKETGIKVYGYLPMMPECQIESRHLGLHLPNEEEKTRKSLEMLSKKTEKTIDLNGLYALAQSAKPLEAVKINALKKPEIRVAVAMDAAFCFIYRENLKILERYGAKIIPFSPIFDKKLPADIHGLILYGGYPELHAKALSDNASMRVSICQAIHRGLPCMAECGGFMYLMEALKDDSGQRFQMAGALPSESFYTSSLKRFGYVTLTGGRVFGEDVGEIHAHEFHYYDALNCGDAFLAKKPRSNREWRCIVSNDTLFAGYPHIHYGGNEKVAAAFIKACRRWKDNE